MSRNRILVGVDFSPESDVAVKQALNLARHRGSDLVLLHACTVPEPPAVLSDYEPPALHDYRARVEADLAADRTRLEELRHRISGQGVEVSNMVIDAFPDTGLCTAAVETDSDLVVLGTHGRTGLKWFFLGSVAQRVVRLCERDVLVARSAMAGTGGYLRVAIATDFSPIADHAIQTALPLTAHGATIDLVHFWNLAPRFGFYEPIRTSSMEELRNGIEEEIEKHGQRLIARYQTSGRTLRFHSVFEPPMPGMIHWLEKTSYDLAVLGSHGRRGFRRFIVGSVAESTARRAPCSVLVVHGGDVAAAAAAAA